MLALSENTGAYEELGEYAVTLYPFDIQQMADALYEALTMPEAERARLLAGAAEQVRSTTWAPGCRPSCATSGCSTARCTALRRHRRSSSLGAGEYRRTVEASGVKLQRHVAATPGAWLSVILIVVAFVLGTFALIATPIPLWIASGVVMVAGIVAGVASRIMEQAY